MSGTGLLPLPEEAVGGPDRGGRKIVTRRASVKLRIGGETDYFFAPRGQQEHSPGVPRFAAPLRWDRICASTPCPERVT